MHAAITIPAPAVPVETLDRPTVPLLSVVVPTKNERDNVAALVDRLEAALPTVAMEILFVDDSTDGTRELVEALAEGGAHDLVLVPQEPQRRICGLGAAVLQGLRAARAPWVCVMDADLQHPPELIAALLEQGESRDLDIVVASRYCDAGDAGSFGWMRAMASRSTTTAARMMFPRRLRGVSDPMSGFFLVRREALDLDTLRPRGFKILLEILVRHPRLRAAEVSFTFGERRAGRSKASIREGMRYLGLLARLRFARFGVVGLSGLVVNTLLLGFFTDVIGLFYVVSAVIATQGSTLWNFCFTELWVFSGRDHRRSRGSRLGMFFLMNNAALALRGPLLVLLTSGFGIHYAVSNVISLLLLTLVRYGLADSWIWAKASPADVETSGPYSYDVHGILSVSSEARLPELERFRVGGLAGEPDIRVRLGRVSASGNGRVGPAIRYREGPGGFGFGLTIQAGHPIEATASPLVGRSPHVLYTNVVEPILRWSFAERGYALVHAACLADRGRAFLLTARTDTGKTTTSLKILDSAPYSFLSDDLTLLTPEGRVLTYPKPLTISRHTLRAVKTPLLSRRERVGLVFQSRLHSRSGRRLAFVLAKTHLPAATINAIVQLLVPPPKFHVERLVPNVEVAPQARLAGMVVIERGGSGELVLDERDALATLLANCEDAYGFPPYSEIEGFLRSRNGMDLADAERAIVAHALSGLPATLLRSDSMDWWSRLPGVVSSWNGHVGRNGHEARAPVHA
ncbi:MAG TPA: glycosyltransferase family 2 protein [Thermoleophilaceae bacterium]|nr:glycosyltransferase family 2 protein [Thermoleophilaceae bacterium]